MEEARLGSAGGHVLHLGNLGEGEALDEEELGGEPLVMRQGIEGLPDMQFLVSRVCLTWLNLQRAYVLSALLQGANSVGTAAAQNTECPRSEA